jgi:hypothetical protein
LLEEQEQDFQTLTEEPGANFRDLAGEALHDAGIDAVDALRRVHLGNAPPGPAVIEADDNELISPYRATIFAQRWQNFGFCFGFSYKPIPTLLVQMFSLPKTPSDKNPQEGQKGGKQKDNAHKTHLVG